MDDCITIENVSKCYLIKKQEKRTASYVTLREEIVEWFQKSYRKIRGQNPDTPQPITQEFWALQGVSLHIKAGERLGIIGRNGAGKSTLLKILARITDPTLGRVVIHGRVASLLEVGTGFHPELTGRENIYLNGAILGMTKREISKKFDEIVDFAGIGEHLDSPVKYYSSGMYMRLAFAIPAHLTPEILLIDEVLAVGDAEFQKKCLGKMGEVAHSGRTVFFVSHNMNAIEQFCDRAILLQKGKIIADSNHVHEVTKKYLLPDDSALLSYWQNPGNQYCHPCFQPIKFYCGDKDGHILNMPIRNDQDAYIFIECMIEKLDPSLCIGYAMYNEYGQCLYYSLQTDYKTEDWPKLQIGYNVIYSKLPYRTLNEGDYILQCDASLYYREWILMRTQTVPCITLKIKGGISDSSYWTGNRKTVLALETRWQIYSYTPTSASIVDK